MNLVGEKGRGRKQLLFGGGTQETATTWERTEKYRGEFPHAAHVKGLNCAWEARTWARDRTSLSKTMYV